MEGVDGVEMCLADIAEEAVEGGVVVGSELAEACGVVDEIRADEGAPVAAVHNVRRLPGCDCGGLGLRHKVLGYHAHVAGDDG